MNVESFGSIYRGLLKGKTKVLTSAKSREAGTVDLKMQISADKYRG